MLDNIASTELLYQFGLALLIGALIGLQREYAHGASSDLFAGVRTYAIIGV
ncbi:MAG: MgtC/SapB family protein, partial [Chloroflexi bacterium]